MAVFDSCGGDELGCDYDSCVGAVQSQLTIPVTAGKTYYVRVAGYMGATGSYTLNVTCVPMGACCVDGNCTGVMREDACLESGGTWHPGEDCATVNCGCADATITIEILTDNWPNETTWEVVEQGVGAVASGGPYDNSNTLITEEVCVSSTRCYDFTIYDAYGDGIYAPGGYAVSYNGTVVASTMGSGWSGSSETVSSIGGGCAPPGACCISGDCVSGETQQSCEEQGGIWFEGEDCATFICPEACCYPNGSCDLVPRHVCLEQGGNPQGPGTTCADVSCPLLYEACCFSDGICRDLLPSDCLWQGGVPQGAATNCNIVQCEPMGACCVRGDCVGVMDADRCLLNGGTWFELLDCTTVTCPLPPEACCIPDLTCAGLVERFCTLDCPCDPDMNCDGVLDAGDTSAFMLALIDPAGYMNAYPDCDIWQADLDCDWDIDDVDRIIFDCVVLQRVPPDCIDIDPDSCAGLEGSPQGPGTDCANVECRPVGACCIRNDCMGVMTEDQCRESGGVWFEG